MKRIFVCLLLALLSVSVAAQTGGIQGKVLSDKGEPIVGASVLLKGTTLGAVTTTSGAFKIANVAAGNYTLVVRSLGYKGSTKEVIVVAGEVLTQDFTLDEDKIYAQEIEVLGRKARTYTNDISFVGTKTGTDIRETPQSISVVTKELIDDRQMYRIGEVAKNVSGVNQFSHYNDLTIRGFRSADDVRLINGLRSGAFFFTQPLLVNIERVEVIKGPASALFGNTYPGGTVNMVTKKPLAEDRKSITFTTGSFNTYRGALDFTGPIFENKSLLYRINIGYENAQSFRNLQFNEALTAAPSVTFLPSEQTSVNFDLVFTDINTRLDRGQPIFGAVAGTPLTTTPTSLALGAANDHYRVRDLYLTLALNHRFASWLSANVGYMKFAFSEDLFEHRNARTFAPDSAGRPIADLALMQVFQRIQQRFTDNLSAYFVSAFKTGDIQHVALVGYDYVQSTRPIGGAQNTASGFRNAANTGTIATYNPANRAAYRLDARGNPVPNVPSFSLSSQQYLIANPSDYFFNRMQLAATFFGAHGIYVQDQLKWNNLSVLLGLRQEWYNDLVNFQTPTEQTVTQRALLPRVGAVYELNPMVNFYATYTQGYLPQTASRQIEPNTGGPFDPLISNLIEGGAKLSFFEGNLLANIALYQIEQNNVLINAGDPTNPNLLRQRGQERSIGIELELIGNILTNWSVNAVYAYNDARITQGLDAEIGKIKENAPNTSAGIWTKYTIDSGVLNGVGFGLGVNYVGVRFPSLTRLFQLPAYTVVDASVFYNFNKFRIAANFNNIANETYWVGGYDFLAIFPGAPRNFLVNVGYQF